MKIKLVLFFGLISFLGFGQEEEIKLPNITPPSPEAQALTKYGDLPMNEFNGMVNYTIPLYTYKVGHLELPISINYTGAGVRVDELPSWVGINWTLNAGGVITRVVKDIADETANERIQLTDQEVLDYGTDNEDGTVKAQYLRALVENSTIDSEADIFNFSFGNYSGSFYLDEDLNPILFKADSPLIIVPEVPLLQTKRIKIITPDGVVYTFGGVDAIEETSLRHILNGTFQSESYGGVTAFYLASIEHPLNGMINFEYTNETEVGLQIVTLQKIHKLRRVIARFPANQICSDAMPLPDGCPNYLPPCFNMLPNLYDTRDYITISSRVLVPRYLKRIHSYTFYPEILFESRALNNRDVKRVLDKIVIKMPFESIDETLKTIDLEYIGFSTSGSVFGGYPDTTKRFFLEKIVFDKDNESAVNTQFGRRNDVFKFYYNNPNSLPERFSYKQDFAGYFNGKNNLSSLPDTAFFNPNNETGFADRKPIFANAEKGTLTHIFYPTGGYTEFEYEAPKAKERHFKTILLKIFRNLTFPDDPTVIVTNPDFLLDGIPKLNDDGTQTGIFNVLENQQIQIKIDMKAIGNDMAIIPQNENFYLKLKDLTANIETPIILLGMNYSGQNNTIVSQTHFESYTLTAGHDYKIEISMLDGTNNNFFEVNATISYLDGYEAVDDVGVRLKKQIDYAINGEPENIKRYYYNTINFINPLVENLPFNDRTFAKTETEILNYMCDINTCCLHPSIFEELHYKFLHLYSDTFNFTGLNGVGNYEHVTISYGGDDFQNGGIEKSFQIVPPFGALEIPTRRRSQPVCNVSYYPHDNPDTENTKTSVSYPFNGNLISEKFFQKKEGVLSKVKEKKTTYDISEISHINNAYGKKLYNGFFFCPEDNGVGVTPTTQASNYFIGQYKLGSNRNNLLSSLEIDYIEPVPIWVTDESDYQKVKTLVSYAYGSLRGLPTIITTEGSDGIITTTKNYYVNQVAEMNTLNPLTNPQLEALNSLATQNIVSNPIQVVKFKGTERLFNQRTLYKNWATPSFPQILPEILQTSKGQELELENRIIYTKYSPYGNPEIVFFANGTITKYSYNNFNQVFIKIENYIPPSGNLPPVEITDELLEASTSPCSFFEQFPESFVTFYSYNSETHLLTGVLDSNCRRIKYEYDGLNRLKAIKRKNVDGTFELLQEFDSSFKRY